MTIKFINWCLSGFRVTVLHKYSEYWVKIPGPVVTQYGVDPAPAETTVGGSSDAKTTTASSMLSRSVSLCSIYSYVLTLSGNSQIKSIV